MTTCSITGCEEPVIARGWCSAHYARWRRRGGDPAVRMPNATGNKALPVPPLTEVFKVEPRTTPYVRVHQWINREYPLVGRCEWCGTTRKKTEYANARSDGFTYNRADWLELCRRCHRCFDGQVPPPPMLGEMHPQAKLTDDEIREIRRLHAEGHTQNSLAERFSVGRSSIGRVVRNEKWTHVA